MQLPNAGVTPFLLGTMVVAAALAFAGPPSAAEPARFEAGSGSQTVGGLDLYFGVVPGDLVREHPAEHPEAQMHGGRHHDIGDRHVMVAIFDAATGRRVTDANVTAFLVGVGPARSEHHLDPMTVNGAVTYGAFMQMPGTGTYHVRVEIRRPKSDAEVTATFDYVTQ